MNKAFYEKYKIQIWSTVFTVVGLFGGNVDRIKEFMPELPVSAVADDHEVRIHNLEMKAKEVENAVETVLEYARSVNNKEKEE